MAENGHCYAVREQLIETAMELLGVEDPELEITLDEMITYKGGVQPSMVSETPAAYERNLWKRLSQSKFRSSFP